MSSLTPHFSFHLPGLGDGIKNGHIWGAHINKNFTDIDTALHERLVIPEGVDGQVIMRVSGVYVAADLPSGLPAYTTANNGMALFVVAGVPAWAVPPPGVPSYTSADYGKLLSPYSGGLHWVASESPANVLVNGATVPAGTTGAVALPVGTPPSAGIQDEALLYAAYPPAFTLVPNMTSNTAPSGVASANSNYSSNPPYLAFNLNGYYTSSGIDGWVNNSNGFPTWLQYQFPAAMEITNYSITPSRAGFPNRVPTAWTLQGSNDGSAWTTLDTQTGLTTGWTADTPRTFTIASASYIYYRINITNNYAGNGNLPTAIRFLALGGPNKTKPSFYVKTQTSNDKIGFDEFDDFEVGVEILTRKRWNKRPVYRTVVNIGTLPNNATTTVAHGIVGVTYFTDCHGVARETSSGTQVFLPYAQPGNTTSSMALIVDNTNITLVTGANRTSFNQCYAILEYVK